MDALMNSALSRDKIAHITSLQYGMWMLQIEEEVRPLRTSRLEEALKVVDSQVEAAVAARKQEVSVCLHMHIIYVRRHEQILKRTSAALLYCKAGIVL